jgi:uncharacterized protein (DUF1330 family)
MTAYVIINYLQVSNEEKICEYRARAHSLVASYGGRVIARPGELHALEGPESEYLFILEFDNIAAARAWYDSSEYQAARSIRDQHATIQVMIVPGVKEPKATRRHRLGE